MRQQEYTASGLQEARPKKPIYSRKVERAVTQSISTLRDYEGEIFACDPSSPWGIRVANMRSELTRLKYGLPVRLDSVLRAMVVTQ